MPLGGRSSINASDIPTSIDDLLIIAEFLIVLLKLPET